MSAPSFSFGSAKAPETIPQNAPLKAEEEQLRIQELMKQEQERFDSEHLSALNKLRDEHLAAELKLKEEQQRVREQLQKRYAEMLRTVREQPERESKGKGGEEKAKSTGSEVQQKQSGIFKPKPVELAKSEPQAIATEAKAEPKQQQQTPDHCVAQKPIQEQKQRPLSPTELPIQEWIQRMKKEVEDHAKRIEREQEEDQSLAKFLAVQDEVAYLKCPEKSLSMAGIRLSIHLEMTEWVQLATYHHFVRLQEKRQRSMRKQRFDAYDHFLKLEKERKW